MDTCKGKTCPLLKKDCIGHGCAFYQHLLGRHPQTGEVIDNWDCAFNWHNILLVETSQQTRQAGAAIESFRNEMVKANQEGVLGLVNAYRQRLNYDENNDNS